MSLLFLLYDMSDERTNEWIDIYRYLKEKEENESVCCYFFIIDILCVSVPLRLFVILYLFGLSMCNLSKLLQAVYTDIWHLCRTQIKSRTSESKTEKGRKYQSVGE